MEDSDKTLEKLDDRSYPDSRAAMEIRIWPIDKLVFYARNPRKNDAVVDHMCGRVFGNLVSKFRVWSAVMAK